MSEAFVSTPTVTPMPTTHSDGQGNPYYAEFKDMLNKPYQSPEQLEAEANAVQQSYMNQIAQCKSEFDQTPAGIRLRQERDEVYGKRTFDKLTEGMNTNSQWYKDTMGLIVDLVMADDSRYQSLLQFYDGLLKDYIRTKQGGQELLNFMQTHQINQ